LGDSQSIREAKLSKLLKQDDEPQFPEAYQVVITAKEE
jgi:hypothetical protein